MFSLRLLPTPAPTSSGRDGAERALWRMMSFYDVPLADLDAAIEAEIAAVRKDRSK